MNSITAPAVFQFESHPVRTVLKDGEPWFVAVDVCKALEYSNTSKALGDHLDADEKGITTGYTLGGQQKLTIISESGLYALVLRSRKPEARKFAKWVTRDVLPAIRKTGAYMDEDTRITIERMCTQVEFLRSWWERYGDAIRILNKTMAGNVHDSFIYAATSSRSIVRKLGLMSNTEFARRYPWEAGYMERMEYQGLMVRA